MYPFSYTGLKLIHDQKVREALERERLYAEQKTQRRDLRQAFSEFLAGFNHRSTRNEEKRSSSPEYASHECSIVCYEQ